MGHGSNLGLKLYRGEAFEHTHENRFFDYLAEELAILCDEQGYDWHLLGNVHVGSRELDGILVKPNAVIALDFKDYGGQLEFSEAGPWRILTQDGDQTEVKGGASVNPFVQLKKNKRALTEFFQRQFSDLDCNWGHIAAAVVFQQPVSLQFNAVPGHLNRWFHITDQQNFLRDLLNIGSLGIEFDYDDQRQIPDLLAISSYTVPKVRQSNFAVSSNQNDSDSVEYLEGASQKVSSLSNSQLEGLQAFQRWLSSDKHCFQLTGMTGTGKRSLLDILCHCAAKEGSEFQALVPSKRHGSPYRSLGLDITSVYSFLYELSPSEIEHGELNSRKVAVHKVKELGDLSRKIVFVLDGHLYSDSELMSTDRRYGTGRLVTDLLTALKGAGARLVVVGDRYQLGRSGDESSLLCNNVFEHFGLEVEGVELLEQVTVRASDALNELRISLVQGLRKRRFNNLRIESGENLKLLKEQEKWLPSVNAVPHRTIMLMPTKEETKKFNGAVKQRLLEHSEPIGIDIGDWVDFYNRTPVLIPDSGEDDFTAELNRLSNCRWIDSGSLAKVKEIVSHDYERQELRGRNGYVELHFVRLRVLVQGMGEVECRCLLNFTNAPDNEISVDESVALNVIARKKAKSILTQRKNNLPEKNSPEYKEARREYDLWEHETLQTMGYASAAFVKVAHAMTVHRSQGRAWNEAWINGGKGPSGDSISNKGYFQWLYTATLAADDCLILKNPPLLSPVSSSLKIDKSSSFSIKPIALKRPFYYSKNNEIDADTRELISGLNVTDELVPIAVAVYERITDAGLEIVSWKESSYRIELVIATIEAPLFRVVMNYDKKLTVNSFTVETEKQSGLTSTRNVPNISAEAFIPIFQGEIGLNDANAVEIFKALSPLLEKKNFALVSVFEYSYQLKLIASHSLGLVEFKVIFNGEGFITKFEVVRASSDSVSELALSLLEQDL